MPSLTALPARPSHRRAASRKLPARAKKVLKLELTAEDIALDNAISSAAARSLSIRRP